MKIDIKLKTKIIGPIVLLYNPKKIEIHFNQQIFIASYLDKLQILCEIISLKSA